jgi:hypothetical protein
MDSQTVLAEESLGSDSWLLASGGAFGKFSCSEQNKSQILSW